MVVVGDVAIDDNNAVNFLVKNATVEQLTSNLSAPLSSLITNQQIVDELNTMLEQTYWAKKIVDQSVGSFECAPNNYNLLETSYYLNCPDCVFPFGFEVGDLSQEGITLYRDDADLVYSVDDITAGLFPWDTNADAPITTIYDDVTYSDIAKAAPSTIYGIPEECLDTNVDIRLPSTVVEDLIERGLIAGEIENLLTWTAATTITEIKDQITQLQSDIDLFFQTQATDQDTNIPTELYPWRNYINAR
jgi:hypothetical protein